MYLQLQKLVFLNRLNKKRLIHYNNVPIKFKVWKKKIGYSNTQCAEILNVSFPIIKRLLKCKTKFTELYE